MTKQLAQIILTECISNTKFIINTTLNHLKQQWLFNYITGSGTSCIESQEDYHKYNLKINGTITGCKLFLHLDLFESCYNEIEFTNINDNKLDLFTLSATKDSQKSFVITNTNENINNNTNYDINDNINKNKNANDNTSKGKYCNEQYNTCRQTNSLDYKGIQFLKNLV